VAFPNGGAETTDLSTTVLMNGCSVDGPKALDGLSPDFLLDFVALIQCMRLSSRKGAHAVLSRAAWQEIRVARLFRPTLAGANMGHPSSVRWRVLLIPPLTGIRLVASS
jgi:hypothetical protein